MNRAFCTLSSATALGLFLLAGCCQQCANTKPEPPATEQHGLSPVQEEYCPACDAVTPVAVTPVAVTPVAQEPVALVAQNGDWGNIKGRVVWGSKEVPVQAPIDKV